MGSALLRGWLAAKISYDITIIEPAGLPAEFQGTPVHLATAPPAHTDIVILAVKPQKMGEACKTLSLKPDTLVLSIAAGQSIDGFEDYFGAGQPIIRAMPNTPAAIGKGVTVAIANANVSPAQKQAAQIVLQATGIVEWINDEAQMDAVTALSGSGPAYVFLLIEAMAAAGENAGLEHDFAMALARQTVIGAAALAEVDAASPASILRHNVTSPGGTTEAALNVLMQDDALIKLMTAAIKAAMEQSKALSG